MTMVGIFIDTHPALFLVSLWMIGTPLFLVFQCWFSDDHILTRGDLITAPLVGWQMALAFGALILVFGPLFYLVDFFDRLGKKRKPKPSKPPSAWARWMAKPVVSC